MEGGLGVFNNAVNTYAEVLGPRGIAAWRRLLIQEWSHLPVLGAEGRTGREGASLHLDYRRFQLNALMERVARTDGDTEALIAVKQRDLSSAHDYLALADLHLSAGPRGGSCQVGRTGHGRRFPEARRAAG